MRKVVAGALAVAALSFTYGARADDASKRQDQRTTATGERKDKEHPLFEGKNNFDLKGKVTEASADKITIQRDELPAATLHVSANTKVEMDGKNVSAQQLKPGQDVKASFNLRGDKPEAVEIKADKPKADDHKEMTDQSRENKEDMQKRQEKQQQR